MLRDKGINLRLTEYELNHVRQLDEANDRSVNSYIRNLIRQAANKSTIDLSPRKKAKQEAEYV